MPTFLTLIDEHGRARLALKAARRINSLGVIEALADATGIARFAAATDPPVRARANAETQALADLVTRRRQVVGLIASERQRASQVILP